ncbi:30S ribosomal protein S1 [Leptolyngbya sp. 7M]|uniref:30S ribosomal protein S1 n=1 Tax=Leptolyngbya sp. 7M TaxID=2812896 RepID=UPI001B8ACFDC|nr:30S ribosomal protein S1 [Leptolyngbya sp. 7M]QYO66354.1 30S ribosomal protein S1 [Leptolyngbya sp. 7M]
MTTDVNNETEETKSGEASAPMEPAKSDAAAPQPTQTANGPAKDIMSSGEIDFGEILKEFEQDQTVFHPGDLVEGKVVGVSDRGALVDFGYKSEGVIPADELSTDPETTLKEGDSVEVVIKSIHSGDAPPTLSLADAMGRKIWNEIEEAYKNDAVVRGKIVDKTKGGLKVDLYGVEAFLPGSQIDSRPIRGLDSYIGEEIEAKIIKFSRKRNNIVLSRKVITDEVLNEEKEKTMANIDTGYIVEGTIKNLTDYGAFVDIGGIDGLLHVTDMSWGRIGNPSEMFKSGDHVQVKILKLDREKEKISLGYKQLLPDPWSTVAEVYPPNSRVKGKVSSVTDYGIFVELEPGVEGLVHVSEISWAKRSSSPKRQFQKGEEVEVQVLGVDTEEKRISLGMKQLQENPWDTIHERFPVGSKIRGKVRNLTDFGAFVEIEDGIDGLVHVSDITWAKKLKHPKELLKKDQEVDAIVTHIDSAGQRLSLSMKDLTPSAWEGFTATHKPGDTIRGKVSRFTNFGVFVELGEGLEGLCHISELSEERVERPEDVVQIGQELDFKILRIENEDQKIGLSYRAVGKDDEPIIDTRQFSSEAKSGMASLGELANLLKNEEAAPAVEMTKEEKEEAKRRKKEQARKEYEEAAAREAAAEAAGSTSEPAISGEAQDPSSGGTEVASETDSANESGADTEADAAQPLPEASETKGETSESSANDQAPVSDVSAKQTDPVATVSSENTNMAEDQESAEKTEGSPA